MASGGTIKPFHDDFQAVLGTTVFTQGVNHGIVISQAFRGGQLVGGATTFSTGVPSGYEFFQRSPPNTLVSNLDSVVMQDLPTLIFTYKIVDSIVMQDLPDAQGPVFTTDAVVMQDFPILLITITPPVDQVTMQDLPNAKAVQAVTTTDSVVMQDLPLTLITISVGPLTVLDTMKADSVLMQDLPKLILLLAHIDSVVMQDLPTVSRTVNVKFTTAIESVRQVNAKFSTEIQVQHYFPTPVNILGDYPYDAPPGSPITAPVSNPFDPTTVFDGVPDIVGDTTTKLSSNYVSFLESQIAPNCDLVSFSMNDSVGGGGTFMIETLNPHPVRKGQLFSLLGFKCLVVKEGKSTGNKRTFFISGVIGDSRLLNKQLLLVLDLSGIRGLGPLAPNTPLQSPPTVQWTSIAAAAGAVAEAGGFRLNWYAKDAPLIDTFLETGQTVGEAIRTLASRVGADVAFDGLNEWNVFTPDTGHGAWGGVTTCKRIGSGGITQSSEIDIVNSVVALAVQPGVNSSVTYIANPLAAPKPMVNTLFATRAIIKSAKIKEYIQVPGDFKESYIQIVIDPDAISGADPALSITAPVTPVSATTAGATYGSNSIASPGVAPPKISLPWRKYAFDVVADDVGNHLLVLQDTDFPPWLVDGKFTLRVGYKRDEQAVNDVFKKNFEEAVQQNRMYLQYQQESIRFVPTLSTQLNFKFFGSLPVCGNLVNFTVDDIHVVGMVDSWSITKDYDVSVNVTLSTKLNILLPKALLDWFLATGTII